MNDLFKTGKTFGNNHIIMSLSLCAFNPCNPCKPGSRMWCWEECGLSSRIECGVKCFHKHRLNCFVNDCNTRHDEKFLYMKSESKSTY